MKIIAKTEHSVIAELTNGEFACLTSADAYYAVGRTFDFCPLIWRTRDVLEAQAKLATAAETLRGLATVISTVDALVPKGDVEAAK